MLCLVFTILIMIMYMITNKLNINTGKSILYKSYEYYIGSGICLCIKQSN